MGKLLSELSLDLRKCPNYKMHESESACFFPMFEIISESSFLIKSYINIVKKNVMCFGQYFKNRWISQGIFNNGLGQCRAGVTIFLTNC